MEKQFPEETPRNEPQIEALRKRAIEIRSLAVEGLKELDRIEEELKEFKRGGEER